MYRWRSRCGDGGRAGLTRDTIPFARDLTTVSPAFPDPHRVTARVVVPKNNTARTASFSIMSCGPLVTVPENMPERLIKKYPNRRLYDTEQSKYITLTQLRQLIIGGEMIKVIDSTSEEDITRTILLQIILETESGGTPLFTADMLSQIIRFYGGTLQGIFGNYLEQSLSLFTAQQEQFQKNIGEDPFTQMANLAQHNMKMWSNLQKEFFNAAGFSGKKEDK